MDSDTSIQKLPRAFMENRVEEMQNSKSNIYNMWETKIFQALKIRKLASVFPLELKDTVSDNKIVMRKKN